VLGLHPSDALVDLVQTKCLASVPPSVIRNVSLNDRGHFRDFQRLALQQLDGVCPEALDTLIHREYEVQCFREEYMAESVALHAGHRPDGWVAVLAGERHIVNRNALPFRALRRVTAHRMKHPSSPTVSNRGCSPLRNSQKVAGK